MPKTRNYDGENIRTRPSRSSRPRSKDRPDYSKSSSALVIAVDRGRSSCLLESNQILVNAMKARELGKQSVVVGDLVGLVGDTSGGIGTLARIVKVFPRKNELSRTVDDTEKVEKRIVANIDQMAIVVAVKNPEPRQGFIDRALVVAFDQGIVPIIILTKTDLANETELLKPYEALGIKIIKTKNLNHSGTDKEFNKSLDILRSELTDKKTVLLGHSGVGKSTLVNALTSQSMRDTGKVNEVTGRGRHTSSSAVALDLNPGWIIDTPGVRSFGIAHVDLNRVVAAFSEFREIIKHCPRNCSHNESTCALNDPAFSESLTRENLLRLESLRRLLEQTK